MGDARFYARTGPHSLAAIATVAKGTAPAIEKAFSGVAPLQSAGPDQVSFLDNRRYADSTGKDHGGCGNRASEYAGTCSGYDHTNHHNGSV